MPPGAPRRRGRWPNRPSCRPGLTWRWARTTRSSLSGSARVSASKLREEPCDAVGVLCLPRPCLDAVPHVTPTALFVGGELRAPDAPRRRQLGPVPVGHVANALVGQGVAGVSAFASTLDEAPGVHQAAHHLADSSLGDSEPELPGARGGSSGGR